MSRNEAAFTLIELLVVIAILVILASILFPVFGRAKECAQQAKCASNLKQFGEAFIMYCSEWEGFYPSPGGLTGDNNYWAQTGPGGLRKYVGNKSGGLNSIWCCPCMKEWNSPYPARTYAMNSFLRSPADKAYPGSVWILDPIRQDSIPLPKMTILLYETFQNDDPPPAGSDSPGISTYRCGDWSTAKGWYTKPAGGVREGNRAWHGDCNNYLYCDGHVKCRRPGKYLTSANHVTWEEAREWYVDKPGHQKLWPP